MLVNQILINLKKKQQKTWINYSPLGIMQNPRIFIRIKNIYNTNIKY